MFSDSSLDRFAAKPRERSGGSTTRRYQLLAIFRLKHRVYPAMQPFKSPEAPAARDPGKRAHFESLPGGPAGGRAGTENACVRQEQGGEGGWRETAINVPCEAARTIGCRANPKSAYDQGRDQTPPSTAGIIRRTHHVSWALGAKECFCPGQDAKKHDGVPRSCHGAAARMYPTRDLIPLWRRGL